MQSLVEFYVKRRTLTHVLFWLVVLVSTYIFWGLQEGRYVEFFYIACALTGIKMLLVYGNLYFLLPRLFLQGKYLPYVVALLILLAICTLLYRVTHALFFPLLFPSKTYPFSISFGEMLKTTIYFFNPILVFTTGVKLLKNWYIDKERRSELEKHALTSELNYLKAQIHPHFFFNTLNNLYALTVQKSDEAPKVLMKLSEVMQYMLYHTTAEKIPLKKEIQHLKNYIELERLRYDSRLELTFTCAGPLDGKMISPLILIPFVENAFKHGASKKVNDCWISINLKIKNGILFFKVDNSSYEHNNPVNDDFDHREGIGLKNVKRRLELLYPGRHELSVLKDANAHWVDLKIKLL